MPEAEVTLPGDASSVPTARRFVDSLLSSWGHSELGWSAALCVSELASNCALHARTSFTVRVHLAADSSLRIEVSDGSLRAPALRAYGNESTTGRGLRILDEVSSSWGVDLTSAGKTVWVALAPEVPKDRDSRDETGEDADLEAVLAAFDDEDDSPAARAVTALPRPTTGLPVAA